MSPAEEAAALRQQIKDWRRPCGQFRVRTSAATPMAPCGRARHGIPSEGTVRRVMEQTGLAHRPRRRSNGIIKADQETRKSDDLMKRDFQAEKPLGKRATDITEITAKDGKLYIPAIFDCSALTASELAMDINMKVQLRVRTLRGAAAAYPTLGGSYRPWLLPPFGHEKTRLSNRVFFVLFNFVTKACL